MTNPSRRAQALSDSSPSDPEEIDPEQMSPTVDLDDPIAALEAMALNDGESAEIEIMSLDDDDK